MSEARWSKASKAWGSGRRVQRNAYAFAVAMVLTGGAMVCPACSEALDLDTAEVDRAVPALDYREGNVCYLCRSCNETRGMLQSRDEDWRDVASYVADVARASESVTVLTESAARAWWGTRPRLTRKASRYA